MAGGATLYLDAAGGSRNWDQLTTAAWSVLSGGPYTLTWTAGLGTDAVFEGTGGAVNVQAVAPSSVGSLVFATRGAQRYTVGGAALNLAATATITTVSDATISSAITGAGTSLTKEGRGHADAFGRQHLFRHDIAQWRRPALDEQLPGERRRHAGNRSAGWREHPVQRGTDPHLQRHRVGRLPPSPRRGGQQFRHAQLADLRCRRTDPAGCGFGRSFRFPRQFPRDQPGPDPEQRVDRPVRVYLFANESVDRLGDDHQHARQCRAP